MRLSSRLKLWDWTIVQLWRRYEDDDMNPDARICFRSTGFEVSGRAVRRRVRNMVQWILIRVLWEVWCHTPRRSRLHAWAAREGAALVRAHGRHVWIRPTLLCPDWGYSGWAIDSMAFFGDICELIPATAGPGDERGDVPITWDE